MASIIDDCDKSISCLSLYEEELPPELWLEIFVKSSVESLLRLKCVCKLWRALISNPSFTKKHLEFQKTTSKNKGRFLLQRVCKHYHRGVIQLSSYYLFDEASIVASVEATSSWSHDDLLHSSFENTSRRHYVSIEGPVNGLYCVYGGSDRTVIWNPATKEVGFLPLLGECLPCKSYTGHGKIGFGTDPLSEEDYKVVMIYEVDTLLYTTSTNTWKILEDDDNIVGSGHPYDYYSNNTYLDGFYYWLVFDQQKARVIAFDMGKNEVFRKISTPNFGLEIIGERSELTVHNDHINLMNMNINRGKIDVWELVVEESIWIKTSVVTGIQSLVKPLGFWMNDWMVLVINDLGDSCSGQTILYDIPTREITKLGPMGWPTCFKTFVHYESLVSLGGKMNKFKGHHDFMFDAIWYFLSGIGETQNRM